MTKYSSKNILIVNGAHGILGGAEFYSLTLYKNLVKNGHNVKFLVAKNSGLAQRLKNEGIPYYTYKKIIIFKNQFQPGLYRAIYKICKQNSIQIIHCNIHREVKPAKKVAKKLPVKVVMTRHIPQKLKSKYLQNLDGTICVSPQIKEYFENKNETEKLRIKEITFIPPFFNEKKFLEFSTKQSKQEFFKQEFEIKTKNLPILCTIAHLNKNKNHKILLHALYELIYKKNKPVQLMLAGDGPLKKDLLDLAINLKIQDYVHFLGFTDKTVELLYHSDIKILPSKQEGMPIVLLEAATLKKPIIGADTANLSSIVINEKTGLLFEQNNINSLVEKIEKLIDDPELIKSYGQEAQSLVLQNYSTQTSTNKLELFYKKILEK